MPDFLLARFARAGLLRFARNDVERTCAWRYGPPRARCGWVERAIRGKWLRQRSGILGVIASEAKQSSCAPVGAPEKRGSATNAALFVCALRACWIASSLRSSQ